VIAKRLPSRALARGCLLLPTATDGSKFNRLKAPNAPAGVMVKNHFFRFGVGVLRLLTTMAKASHRKRSEQRSHRRSMATNYVRV